jgi:hypothetical protein
VCNLSLRGEGPVYGVINSLACCQTPEFICHTLIECISLLDNIIDGHITFQGGRKAPLLPSKEPYILVSFILNTRTLNWIAGSNYYVSFKLSVILRVTGRDKLLTAATNNGACVTLRVLFYNAVFASQ